MYQLEIAPELKEQIREYLQKQGYRITEGAKLLGKSGIEHTFDMLAQKDDNLNTYTVGICVTTGGNKATEANTIFSFANKAYDTGIQNRILIAIPELTPEAKQLAQKQRIKVVNVEQILETLVELKPALAKPSEPLKFETKEQLIKSLASRGYSVTEKARVTGKSGVDYTFDILAYVDNGQVSQNMVIDFLRADRQVSLEQVSLFDTKAYDAGVDYKAIVVSPDLSPEARRFAEHQKIKIFTVDLKTAPSQNTAPAMEKKALQALKRPQPEQKPAQTPQKDATAAKQQSKAVRQAPPPEVLKLIPEVTARRYNAIPVALNGDTLQVAMADPTDIFALEAFAAQSRKRIEPVKVSPDEVREAIDFNYKGFSEIEKRISSIEMPTDFANGGIGIESGDTPLTQALNLIIEEGIKARASDIHIEPEEDRLRIRYRIDGTLQDMMSLPMNIRRALISRIKILADLNIADQHHPQDGQFSMDFKDKKIDVRVAVAPSVWGEMSVLRLLDKSMAIRGLVELGMTSESLTRYEEMLKVPYGMILISGPTGAGKTTTLYASVNSLDKVSRNVITVEDPAEYRFKDINQIQVNRQAGITFASGLRSILRLDPDVILVGEIRDAETANIAVQSALTGHLMLSSIHANDTVGVLFRLLDLKIESFLIATSIIGIVAQRMVRRICPHCSHLIEAPALEQMVYAQETGEKETKFLYGTGCVSCAYTGYLGRVGIFEILTMSDELKMMFIKQASHSEIKAQALKEGMITMLKDGMRKVKAGITTPTEILHAAYTIT